ncbi:negative regulator of sigma-X activity [Pseudoneobacillus sp. C159]
MKKSEWSDKELEELLRQMPKMKDHRDPRDIYQSLSLKAKKRKNKAWIVPSIASVAAALLLFILAPQVWQVVFQDSSEKQKSEINVAHEDAGEQFNMAKIAPDVKDNIEPKSGAEQGISIMSTSFETALYEDELVDQDVITYTIPDQNAQLLVPVSIMVPKDGKSWLDHYLDYQGKLTEEQWGLTEYYPLNAKLTMVDDRTLNVDVKEGHRYLEGSASEVLFFDTMKGLLQNYNLDKITFSTNGNPGIVGGNTGETQYLSKQNELKHSYFVFQPNNQNSPFIVPGIDTFTDIESALSSMKVGYEAYGLQPSLPADFNFEIDSSLGDVLLIKVADGYPFTEEPKNIYAIEAILLTSKEFGYKAVKFENTNVQQIGRFNLQNEIKVPIAPNKVYY